MNPIRYLSVCAFALPMAAATALFAADAPPSASPPPADASAAHVVPSPSARRNPGPPATPAELAEIAKLMDLPVLKPGAGTGDYLIRPPYDPAPELTPRADVPKGRIERFSLKASDSKFYPGTGTRDAKPTREIIVYVPKQYVDGTSAPFIVTQDAYGARNDQLPTVLDNMIVDKRLPTMVAIMVNNGGGDGRGSERGLEYDTVSGKYAEFVQAEVLPAVEKNCDVTLTKDPEGRATMGGSSGASAAFTMAWFHPEWYRRVLSYPETITATSFPSQC